MTINIFPENCSSLHIEMADIDIKKERKRESKMPSLAMYKVTPPTDSKEFERICADYLEHKYNADVSEFGRRGQRQYGIDLIVKLEDFSYILAQCKDVKSVTTSKLDDWIADADKDRSIPMKQFVIIVAIDTDAQLQKYICNVSIERVKNGKTPVDIIFWQDVIHYVKKNPTMLRMYYPQLCLGQDVKIEEAVKTPEQSFPERIVHENQLRGIFFDEAVKYRIEEFLAENPKNGISSELVGYADAFLYACEKLSYRAPLLTYCDFFLDMTSFCASFDAYCDFFPNVTETRGDKIFATNKYDTKEEAEDLIHNDQLRQDALEKYRKLKEI